MRKLLSICIYVICIVIAIIYILFRVVSDNKNSKEDTESINVNSTYINNKTIILDAGHRTSRSAVQKEYMQQQSSL